MKNRKKTLALLLAGLMATVALLGVAGCAGTDDKPAAPDPTPAPSPAPAPDPEPTPAAASASPLVGTWPLLYAHDFAGNQYNLGDVVSMSLEVTDESTATFKFGSEAPYAGTLSRRAADDATYAVDGFDVKVYQLDDGSHEVWVLVYVTPKDGSAPFWYVQLWGGTTPSHFYLCKDQTNVSGLREYVLSHCQMVGTWRLSEAISEDGTKYDLSDTAKDSVRLEVTTPVDGTFHYFDDDPYTGKFSYQEDDATYATESFIAYTYRLEGSDNSYWEMAFVTPEEDTSYSFWVIKVGSEHPDTLYLSRVE